MRGRNPPPRRIMAGLVGCIAVLTLIGGLGSTVGAIALGDPASSETTRVEIQDPVSAPLKPDWVEALLDARATALHALLDAHDLQSAGDPASSETTRVEIQDPVSAPLKPDWVEALLDAHATALRALLEADDLQSTRGKPR